MDKDDRMMMIIFGVVIAVLGVMYYFGLLSLVFEGEQMVVIKNTGMSFSTARMDSVDKLSTAHYDSGLHRMYLGIATDECVSCFMVEVPQVGTRRIMPSWHGGIGTPWPYDSQVVVYDPFHLERTGNLVFLANVTVTSESVFHTFTSQTDPYFVGDEFRWFDIVLDKVPEGLESVCVVVTDGVFREGTDAGVNIWGFSTSYDTAVCVSLASAVNPSAYNNGVGFSNHFIVDNKEFGIFCSDGEDNDGDILVDCGDPDCDCLDSNTCEKWGVHPECVGDCPEGYYCQSTLVSCACVAGSTTTSTSSSTTTSLTTPTPGVTPTPTLTSGVTPTPTPGGGGEEPDYLNLVLGGIGLVVIGVTAYVVFVRKKRR